MKYNDIVKLWKAKKITNYNELANIFDSYSINFAYNSGKIENNKINYNYVR